MAAMRRRPVLLVAVILAGACGAAADAPPRAAPGITSLDEALEWEREFTLEENDRTINVAVRAAVDPAGGFLIADEREGFVRRYSMEGRLLAQFGGKGHGPAEFPSVLAARRLSDGRIVVFDVMQRGAIFAAGGDTLLRTFRTPFSRVHAAMVLDDSLALIGAQLPGQAEDHRLHVWNLERDSLIESFFAPPLPSTAHQMAAGVAGWVEFARRGDTLAVVTSLSDTVYLMTLHGRVLERIAIPSTALRRLDPNMALPGRRDDIGEARQWMSQFSLISHIHWIGDTFIVQYLNLARPEPRWGLIAMRRDGAGLVDAVDTPELFFADPATGLLYLQAPEEPAPNVWRVARLRDRAP